MGYFRFEDNGDVGGAMNNGRSRRNNGNGDVAGAMDNGRSRRNNGNGDVAGAFDRRPMPVRVQGVVNAEDLCRAVRRCLINDLLVAGAQDEEDDNDNHCCHSRRRNR